MAGKLSFSIAINLLTENFKRGTSSVKNGLRAMQMQVLTFAAALGAGGIGLTDFVTRLIDVARETSRVTTALKNASGGMGQFADNQRFLLDMAKKYGLEINALTGNFAKFTAASQVSGMSMANQRKIFESVSRACTAFGMSADDSNGVFLALSQMMSKGKISSEELRLQMGERLPIALQAMAKAAGVSVGGLDKLMKQGKLMSKDVLPGFADALNEMLPNVDTDNIETSVNRLKNTFTEFTNGTGVQNAYKGIIDWLTGAVQSAGENIKNIVIGTVAVISGLIANTITKTVRGWGTAASQLEAFSQTANNRAVAATAKRVASEQALEKAKLQQALAVGSQRVAASEAVAKAEARLASTTAAEVKAKEVAKAASSQAAAVASSGAWGKAYTMLKIGAAKLVASLKAMWSTFAPMIIVSAIVAIIGKFKAMYDEANRIRSIFADYQKNLWNSGNTAEVTRMQVLVNVMNDRKKSQNEINAAQSELQRMIGKENLSQEELNKLVKTRIALLREAAMAEAAFGTAGEYSEKNAKLAVDTGLSTDQMDRLANLYPGSKLGGRNEEYYREVRAQVLKESGPIKVRGVGDFDRIIGEYFQNSRVINDATSRAGKYQESANKINTPPGGGTPDDKKSALQKAEEEYANKLKEYANQRDNGALKELEYNKAIDELNEATYKKIGGLLTPEKALQNETFTKSMLGTYNPRYDEKKEKAAEELEKVQKEYTKAIELAKVKLDKKLISEDDYRTAIIDAATSAADSAISIKGIGASANGFINKVQGAAIAAIEAPVLGKRDSTFDYKASDTDKISGELDVWKKYRDELKDLKSKHKILSEELQAELTKAIQKVPTLEEALKIAKVKEDVKQFSQELSDGIYSGMKDVASSADRLVSSFQNLDEVFDPESEASGWERLMAVWSAMTNAVDSFLSIAKTMESLAEITDKLTKARASETQEIQKSMGTKVAEATVDTTVTGTKVANSGIKIAADNAEKNAVVANAGTEVVANTAKAGSAAAASVAGIPIVGLALAAAAVATIIGIFASLPKFATGGIVGGNSPSGDKILARLNSGELILNKGQQSKLSDAIESGRSSNATRVVVGGSVDVTGAKMRLTIENDLKKKGKKIPW